MTITTSDTIPTSKVTILTALRTLAAEPPHSFTAMRHAADRQARLVGSLLPTPLTGIPAHLPALLPSIRVDYLDIPVPGTAFWGNGHWHIHIRTNDPITVQVFTVLHELKHIIDHPLRQQPNVLSNTEWEAIADHFAHQVLAQDARAGRDGMVKKDGINDNTLTTAQHSSSQPSTSTGATR